jgi:hypothetical protein
MPNRTPHCHVCFGSEAVVTAHRQSRRLRVMSRHRGCEMEERSIGTWFDVARAPIFVCRGGSIRPRPTLGDDFRATRASVFGNGEVRQLADFRRSGAVQAVGSPMCARLVRRGSVDEPGYANKNRTKVSWRRTTSLIASFNKNLSD